MKKVILLIICLSSLVSYAQNDSLINEELTVIKEQLKSHSIEIENLNEKHYNQKKILIKKSNSISYLIEENISLKKELDSVSKTVSLNEKNIVVISEDLGGKIKQTESLASSKIIALNSDIDKNQFYWIIATLLTLLIGGVVFWLLGRRIASSKNDVESQINKTKTSLEEESLKLDSKLVEVLESQLKIQEAESKTSKASSLSEKEDHSLALKVADEIVRMQKNISRIDHDTKGLKPLGKGIERIQANFAANGYEMVNLLNKDYEDRMNIDVINFLEDDNLEKGRKIITKIIKPQVNYNDVLIQRAQVEVSQN